MTQTQRRMLDLAERAPRSGWDGVAAVGQKVRTAESLARGGLLRFVGWGMCVEGDDDGKEARIYEITDAGREALRALVDDGEGTT